MPRGKPFVKGDPRINKTPSGRPKKSAEWKVSEDMLREALARMLQISQDDIRALLKGNPSGAEIVASKFVLEYPPDAVIRFLGRVPEANKLELTGKDGTPLVPPATPLIDFSKFSPEKIRALIEETK